MDSLRELTIKAASLTNELVESGGEISPELEQALIANEFSLANKIDAYASVLERLDAEIAHWKTQKADADMVLKRLEGAKDRLRDSLKTSGQALGESRLEGQFHKISITPSKGRLIIDEEALDKSYTRVVQSVEADTSRIREALDRGETVAGAHIEPGMIMRISKGSRSLK